MYNKNKKTVECCCFFFFFLLHTNTIIRQKNFIKEHKNKDKNTRRSEALNSTNKTLTLVECQNLTSKISFKQNSKYNLVV